jgi:pimeloyl-ACP methyl ester carboxylesterase
VLMSMRLRSRIHEERGVTVMMTRVTVRGAEIAIDDSGAGDAILLLHGSGPGASAAANWETVIPTLRDGGYRVVAPDIVGFGESSRPADFAYLPARWAESIRDLLDALDIEAAHLVGNSMGGRIALNLAARHSERVRTVTVMGVRSPSAVLSDGLRRVREYDDTRDGMEALFKDYFVVNRDLVTDRLISRRFAAATRKGEAEHYKAMFSQAGANDLGLSADELRVLPRPVQVIQGREDKVVPMQDAIELAVVIPDCVCTVIPNCGHWVQFEQPAFFVGLLELFLATGIRHQPLGHVQQSAHD